MVSIRGFLIPVFTLISYATVIPALISTGFGESAVAAIETHTHPQIIVVGFVGGFIKHDNPVHSEVQLATRLREAYPQGVDVETFESYNRKKAREKILALLDTDHDGSLTTDEKQNARIILYGHSWGAAAAIRLARELERDSIPVLLTVQVDSVHKLHQNDALIPPNVARAANFYQPNGLVHGQTRIQAVDPLHTQIIGNFRFDYKGTPYTCDAYPWYDRFFVKTHTQIECDPKVWEQAESLIRADLPPTLASRLK